MKKLVIYHVNLINRGRGSAISYLPELNNYMFLYTSDNTIPGTKLLKTEENNSISEEHGIPRIEGNVYYYEFFGRVYKKDLVKNILKEELGLEIEEFEIIESTKYPPTYL